MLSSDKNSLLVKEEGGGLFHKEIYIDSSASQTKLCVHQAGSIVIAQLDGWWSDFLPLPSLFFVQNSAFCRFT